MHSLFDRKRKREIRDAVRRRVSPFKRAKESDHEDDLNHVELTRLERALLKAAETGNLDDVRSAVNGGVDVNVKTPSSDAKWAVAYSRPEDEYARDYLVLSGATALHLAAFAGHVQIVEFLLKKGADINARTLEGKTALMIAKDNHKSTTAEFLELKGAKV